MPPKRELHDRFFKQAKAEGYAARSAYKLKHIQDRYRLIRPGDRVLDLGCAPGSWLQVAAELVGPRGDVAGIDLQPIEVSLPPHARASVADIFKTAAGDLAGLGQAAGDLYDVVLSDMAPATTGDPGGDHFRSVELTRRVLDLLPAILMPAGHAAMKVFEGEAYPALLREFERVFDAVKGFKPESTRQMSREMFIVAKAYRGGPGGTAAPRRAAPGRERAKPPEPAPGWNRRGPSGGGSIDRGSGDRGSGG